jgi:hypothetical protein
MSALNRQWQRQNLSSNLKEGGGLATRLPPCIVVTIPQPLAEPYLGVNQHFHSSVDFVINSQLSITICCLALRTYCVLLAGMAMGTDPFEAWWRKFLFIPILVVTTTITTALVICRSWTTQGALLQFTDNNRPTLSFIVQILSASLGAADMYVVRELTSYYLRLKLMKKWVGLDQFAFWNVLCAGSPSVSLPVGLSALTILAYLFAIAIAALWAGAITPTTTLKNCSFVAVGVLSSLSSLLEC